MHHNNEPSKNTILKHEHQQAAVLYIIATPIGNLEDISQRALRLLAEVDCIYAEDTRNSRKLLTYFGIANSLQSLHEFNESSRVTDIIQRLESGENLAIVSDAGTPLISDPGYKVVNAVSEAGYQVCPIPGPSAIITALSAAGLPTHRFTFEGFLPAKSKARKAVIKQRLDQDATLVFYESSHRIVDSVQDFIHVVGNDRQVVLARELTKLYEQFYRGTLSGLAEWLQQDSNHLRGEFVLVVAGREPIDDNDQTALNDEHVLQILLKHLSVKQSAQIAADLLGKNKNGLYKLAMKLNEQ